ncbi:lanthionine synthetase LanC family protein [Sphingobacterium sp.]|uniref:lanthionine synthetase LanC family protein n=1 Tax=Sphingobacterium sp. TaxID=341027 RepID=UPI0031D12A60
MERIKKFIEDLDNHILAHKEKQYPISLIGGSSGIIYYCFNSANKKLKRKGFKILESLIEQITNEPINNTPYVNGICGVMYLLNHLRINGEIEDDIDDFLLPIEDLIINKAIPQDYKLDNKDFFYGIFGYLHYFVSKPQSIKTERIIVSIVNDLISSLSKENNGFFLTNNHYNKNKVNITSENGNISDIKAINFGLAHGNLAFGLILVDILNKYPNNNELTNILQGIINLYLDNIYFDNVEKGLTIFPNLKFQGGRNIFNAIPMSWCYGDLSVAIFFYKCGILLKNATYKELSIKIANMQIEYASKHLSTLDPYFCHGFTGASSQFQTLYNLTKVTKFLEQSLTLQQTAFFEINKKIEDFDGSLTQFFDSNLDLLNGFLGFGLLCNGRSEEWKQIFLN